ncbi:MAG: MATE family efflux transporter [Oscillospiraceae bacterium]|nr:MATE family efflux transporter [Oscillospiraceae bacterium]
MRIKNVNMLSGSITRGLLSMSIPIMIMNVMQSIFTIIDMTALKYFSADSAVGAIGVCGSLITLVTSLLVGVASGANVVVAKRIGQGNREDTNHAAMTAILTAVVGGLLLLVIGVVFAETFLKLTDCPDTLLPKATVYFKLYFLGVPILMFYNFCASILRAIGDTKKPMFFIILAGILKVIFTVLFLMFTDMTVEGVAIATIIGQGVAAVLAFVTILRNKETIQLDFKKIRFYAKELKEMLFIGVPTGLQHALYSFANVVIVTAVNGFGEFASTGLSIANQFDGILYNVSVAPSLAVMPYVAQNAGAGDVKRVKKIIIRAILITTAFGASLGSLSAIFSGQLSSIMSDNPEVIKYSMQKMVIISSTYFICGINEVMGGILKGLGKPIVPTVATLIFMCLIRFPWVWFIFPLFPNLTFLYLIWPIGWVLSIATQLFAYFPAISKLQKKVAVTVEE